jgi:hypothetical protein
VENFEEERPHGRPRWKGENCLRMDIKGIGWEVVDWIHVAQDKD